MTRALNIVMPSTETGRNLSVILLITQNIAHTTTSLWAVLRFAQDGETEYGRRI